jgi:tetratricopeptide (TPR) repeat protein
MGRCLLLLMLGLGAALAPAAELPWRDNPAASRLLPPGGERPVLLYFTAPWCVPCKLMEREVFQNPDGRAELANFELVRLDLENPAGRSLADSFRVGTVPTFVMLDPGGAEIERIRGYRSRRLLLRDLARFRAGEGTTAVLRDELAASPGDPRLQAELGLRRYEHLELDTASRLLEASLRDPAELPDTLAANAARALADLHRRRGEPEEGARVLELLLERHPDHAYPRVSWQLLATCRRESGDPRGAVRALGEAAATEPIRAAALIEYARAAAAQDMDLERAETAASDAVELTGREDPEALAALADVLRRRHRYPEAMMWIKRAMALAPDDPRWTAEREVIFRAAIRGD